MVNRFMALATRVAIVVCFLSTLVLPAVAENSRTMKWFLPEKPVSGRAGDTITMILKGKVSKNCHTYSADKVEGPLPTEFTILDKGVGRIGGKIRATSGAHRHYDSVWSTTIEEWSGNVTVEIPIVIGQSLPKGDTTFRLKIYYQICDDVGCAPPDSQELRITVSVTDASTLAAAPDVDSSVRSAADTKIPVTTAGGDIVDKEFEAAKAKGLWYFFFYAMGFGFLSLLTPCVFPMIPITVSFFTKRREKSKARGVRDSMIFGLGIVCTFMVLGLLLAAFTGGTGAADLAANPITNIVLALIFLVLAFNLFGAFEIQVPVSIMNRLNTKAQGEGLSAVWMMGLVFSLTSFTCTAAFLGTLLFNATKQGAVEYTIIGTLGYSVAFALPFVLLSMFPSLLVRLPRSGGWMNNLKVVMGFVEIAAAVKFISSADLVEGWGIMPRELFLAIWAAVCILSALYILGAFAMTLDSKVERVGAARVMFSTMFLAIALWCFLGAIGRPMSSFAEALLPPDNYYALIDLANGSAPTSAGTDSNKHVAGNPSAREHADEVWINDLAQATKMAKELNKPIFIDFTGFTCTNCRLMEKFVFPKPVIQERFKKFVLVQLYTDKAQEPFISNQSYMKTFGTVANPLYVMLKPDGTFIAKSGYLPKYQSDPATFAAFLDQALK